ncbi:MAG: alpha/beta hydrolase [Clostridia bacterium]|nr:alpha/beta hydrolase [Clostridia bacterium]
MSLQDVSFPFREENYHKELTAAEAALAPFCRDGCLTGRDRQLIRYRIYVQQTPRGAMVLCHDGCESLCRYVEWAAFYFYMGYQVYLFDFRGHGGSSRQIDNRSVTHIDDFDEYARDLADLTSRIDRRLPLCVTAFGMGAAAALLYMQKNPDRVSAACLIAPLLGLELPEPAGLYRWRLRRSIKRGLSRDLVPGSSCYEPGEAYAGSDWRSFARFSWYRRLRSADSRLQNNAYTMGWLSAALEASDRIYSSKTGRIATRVLLVQAGQDQVVPYALYGKLLNLLPEGKQVCLSEAGHRIQNGDDKTIGDLMALLQTYFGKLQ